MNLLLALVLGADALLIAVLVVYRARAASRRLKDYEKFVDGDE